MIDLDAIQRAAEGAKPTFYGRGMPPTVTLAAPSVLALVAAVRAAREVVRPSEPGIAAKQPDCGCGCIDDLRAALAPFGGDGQP